MAAIIAVSIFCATSLAAATILVAARRVPLGAGLRRPPSVVTVVAARNEEDHLAECLSALKLQEAEFRSLHFVIVDDHSSDSTAAIAKTFAANDKRFIVAEPPAADRGKALAIAHGASLVDADVIATTDADCNPPKRWLAEIVGLLTQSGYDLVCGPTVVTGKGWNAQVQRLDWLMLFGVAGAFSAVGLPITAMGNNMAIRRDAYEAVGGYVRFADTPTEDYALFRAVNLLPARRSRLVLEPGVVNYTQPEPSLRLAFHQRKRWARGGLQASWWVRLLYLVVWAAHLLPVLTLFSQPAAGAQLVAAIVSFDALLLASTSFRLGEGLPWTAMPAFEVYKFVYLCTMPFALLLRPSIEWKGRSY
ncbi:MAG: glycosyltransferase [Rhodothermales bacterium]|nr:glycosyltransferase [Rhodothermales bacterium]